MRLRKRKILVLFRQLHGLVPFELKQKPLNPIESVTFKTLVDLIDAKVLGGQAGMDKKLDKFVIGAMTPAAMRPYITRNSLLIVGNREDAQRLALEDGAAVLITGGFETSSAIIALADDQQLPVLQTAYDTFTVATMINRALSDQAIKQDTEPLPLFIRPFHKSKRLAWRQPLAITWQ